MSDRLPGCEERFGSSGYINFIPACMDGEVAPHCGGCQQAISSNRVEFLTEDVRGLAAFEAVPREMIHETLNGLHLPVVSVESLDRHPAWVRVKSKDIAIALGSKEDMVIESEWWKEYAEKQERQSREERKSWLASVALPYAAGKLLLKRSYAPSR